MGEGQHPDSSKGIRKHVSSLRALGVGTAPWIQLKESGIPLALWGGGGGDNTRYSTKGIRNPSSSSGGSEGGRQEKSPPEFFLAS